MNLTLDFRLVWHVWPIPQQSSVFLWSQSPDLWTLRAQIYGTSIRLNDMTRLEMIKINKTWNEENPFVVVVVVVVEWKRRSSVWALQPHAMWRQWVIPRVPHRSCRSYRSNRSSLGAKRGLLPSSHTPVWWNG